MGEKYEYNSLKCFKNNCKVTAKSDKFSKYHARFIHLVLSCNQSEKTSFLYLDFCFIS